MRELREDEIRTLQQKTTIDKTSEQSKTVKKSKTAILRTPGQKKGARNKMKTFYLQPFKRRKQYLKSLFEVLILMGKQSMPLGRREDDEISECLFILDNSHARLECWVNSGEEVLKKHLETTVKTQENQTLELWESCVREETLRE